ncbi:eukaryotic translation initiation factor 4E-1A-like isoform X2 [Convolutriloba macropyga]|uniref:eukaryotic translation initiation factor 4E-1A-like isoform X2 n=1 Tax=Convolutriloba macropyga TaxID=536237 RepID=UPI003F5267B0
MTTGTALSRSHNHHQQQHEDQTLTSSSTLSNSMSSSNSHYSSHQNGTSNPSPPSAGNQPQISAPPLPPLQHSANSQSGNSNQPVTTASLSQLSSSATSSAGMVDDEMRHPLENVWVLWFLQASATPGKWEDNLKIVHKFSTVEDFWSLFNHIKPASQLVKGCDYCLFKDGIIPKWEDEKNKQGGRWVLPIPKTIKEEVDKYWLETLLCLIGEAFDDDAGALVNGCVVSVRPRGDRVSIWVGSKEEEHLVTQIGKKIKERLKLKPSTMLNFQAHDDAITRCNSVTKNMYQV